MIRVLTSVTEIGAAAWEQLGEPRSVFETRDWLAANEASLPGEPVVTAESDGADIRSVVIWRATDGTDSSPYYNIAALLTRLMSVPPAMPAGGWTLNCAGSGMHSPMLAAPGVAFGAARVRTHLEAASTARREPPAMCGFNFVPRVPAPGLPQAFAELGLREFSGYQRAILELPGSRYDDYLAALTSRQRWNARRDRRRFAETGQRISMVTGPTAAGWDLVRLQGRNRRKYGLPHDAQALRDKHAALLRGCGDDGLVIRSMAAGRTAGFTMFFRMGTTMHALFAGFEPHSGRTGPYFECLFHAAIEWAYRNGVTEIDYGIGATGAKCERGCQVHDMATWYR